MPENSTAASRLIKAIDSEIQRLSEKWNTKVEAGELEVHFLRYEADSAVKRNFRYRLVASNAYWALSCRANENTIELFSLPATHVAALFEEETATRLKFRLRLQSKGKERIWLLDSSKIEQAELEFLLRAAFKELTSRSLQEAGVPADAQQMLESEDVSLTGRLRALIVDKHNIAEKLVIQQEMLQAEFARNIHDAAIGRLMILKSSLVSSKPPGPADIVEGLNEVIDSLRETCSSMTPRDLRDWGLAVVVQDLVMALAKRTGADCDVSLPETLPYLPPEVELNAYRIIQEALTNAEKHSQADKVRVNMKWTENKFVIEILDNGKGIGLNEHKGSGMNIMRERVDLIKGSLPASITVDSAPETGTCIRLTLTPSAQTVTESATR